MRAIVAWAPTLVILAAAIVALSVIPWETPIPCSTCTPTVNGTLCSTCAQAYQLNVLGISLALATVVAAIVTFAVRWTRPV